MKPEILLLGAGGHCKSVIDVIEQENKFKIAGIIDADSVDIGQSILGYHIIGTDSDLSRLYKKYKYALITVGYIKTPHIRIKLYNLLKKIGYKLPVIISPLAYVSKHSHINEGTIIMHHSIVNATAKVGKNSIINTKALIEHDAIIEDNCHISTGSIVNGGVHVRENTFYGSNATSKEYIEVDGFIKAGSVVK